MLDLVNVALRTLMCLAFLIWVVRPMLLALSRREPNQLEIEEVVDSAVHSAFRSLGVKNPPLRVPLTENSPPPADPATSDEVALMESNEVTETSPSEVSVEQALTAQEDTPQAEQTEVSEEITTRDESNPEDALKEMRERIKQEQKNTSKPSIPAELLQDASSYEDKLMVVRMMVDQEHARVASVLKRMIKID